MNATYLGIDIGTSGCKVAAFDANGALCAFAAGEYELQTDANGRAELDAEEVLRMCRDAVRTVTAQRPPPVAALGVTCQGEAFTAVSRSPSKSGHGFLRYPVHPVCRAWLPRLG